ncbi:hypothetical protein MMC29_006313 [Sticta canariensis]|nr:hypothetical protein [Sticta canariensis]
MLKVDRQKIEVLDTHAWNEVLKEDRFDLDMSWANAASMSYSKRIADGIGVLPPTLSHSADRQQSSYIPTTPRMLDALLDQVRYRVAHAEDFDGQRGNRPGYRLNNYVRHLHLEKPRQ